MDDAGVMVVGSATGVVLLPGFPEFVSLVEGFVVFGFVPAAPVFFVVILLGLVEGSKFVTSSVLPIAAPSKATLNTKLQTIRYHILGHKINASGIKTSMRE